MANTFQGSFQGVDETFLEGGNRIVDALAFFSSWMTCRSRMMKSSIHTSSLSVIQDGMDQAKFRMPRFRSSQRRSKLSERLFRPTMHILACWLHGHSLRFYVSNEDMPKNSETSCEATARALSDAFTEVGSLPLTLYVQHDGTYREAKNQFYMSFLLVLTVLQVFRQCYISFLRPGHSHEDVDQIFSQVSGMLSSQTFSNPDELVDLLNLTCQPDTRAQSLRQKKRRLDRVAASSCRLDQTAQWKEWVAVAGVKLKGLRLLLIRK